MDTQLPTTSPPLVFGPAVEPAGPPPPLVGGAGQPADPPPPPLPVPAGGEGPLSVDHIEQLEQANRRARKVRKAGGVAMFNGIVLAIAAGGSGLYALVSPLFGELDLVGAIVAVGLSLAAVNEFRGRGMLRRFDRRASRVLGWGQLGLMALLIGYGAWMLANAYYAPNVYADAIAAEPMLASSLASIGETYKLLSLALYGGLIAATLIFQGLNAVYYFTRAKHLRAYLDETPGWVVEVQRRTVGG